MTWLTEGRLRPALTNFYGRRLLRLEGTDLLIVLFDTVEDERRRDLFEECVGRHFAGRTPPVVTVRRQ